MKKLGMRTPLLIFISLLLLLVAPLSASTYYVDSTNGLDTNTSTQAQTKATAWQHAPGMPCATSNAASYSVQPNDQIIFIGGGSWGNSCFMWNLTGGTSGNPVYYGVDKTWYLGSSWVRPVLNGGGEVVSNNNNQMVEVQSYATLDNFEITGFYWNTASCTGTPNCTMIDMGQRVGQTLENLYIHGWTHAGTNTSTSNGVAVGILTGAGSGSSVAHDIVIVGTDVSGDHSLTAFYGGPPTVYNVFCQQVASCFITSLQNSVHDNTMIDVGPAYCNVPTAGYCTHENSFEDNGDTGLNFYNNVISGESGGLALWIAPYPGYTANMWNNVISNIHDNQVLDFAPPVYNGAGTCPQGATGNSYCLAAGNYVFWNNTVECGDDTTQYDQCQSNVGVVGSGSIANSLLYQNNHFISLTTASGCATGTGSATSCTFASSNLVQTLATANGQGYTSAQTYVFSPTAAYPTDSTPGQGTSASSLCTSSGAGTPCLQSTTYGVAYNSTNHTVTSPSLTPVNLNNPPDIGAYQYQASSTYSITISSITGHGTVADSQSLLNCTTGTTGTCSTSSATGSDTLTFTPSAGYSLGTVTGCTVSGSTCTVTTTATITATFTASPTGKTAPQLLLAMK